MYIPPHFEETNISVLHALITSHALGIWVTQSDSGMLANHIPFFLDKSRGEYGTLIGHVARSNAIWKTPGVTKQALIIFQGAQGYISPSWYPSKKEHGKAVPSWNYMVVHARGVPCIVEEPSRLLDMLEKITMAHEAGRVTPWHISDAPADYMTTVLNGIIGIEIPITCLQGKWKMSQNKSETDQQGVLQGLMETDQTDMLNAMTKRQAKNNIKKA